MPWFQDNERELAQLRHAEADPKYNWLVKNPKSLTPPYIMPSLPKRTVASVITTTGTQYVAISERSISAPMVTKNIAV